MDVLSACTSVHNVHSWCYQRPEERIRSNWDWSYKMTVSLPPLEEYPVLLTADPSLQTLLFFFFFWVEIDNIFIAGYFITHNIVMVTIFSIKIQKAKKWLSLNLQSISHNKMINICKPYCLSASTYCLMCLLVEVFFNVI